MAKSEAAGRPSPPRGPGRRERENDTKARDHFGAGCHRALQQDRGRKRCLSLRRDHRRPLAQPRRRRVHGQYPVWRADRARCPDRRLHVDREHPHRRGSGPPGLRARAGQPRLRPHSLHRGCPHRRRHHGRLHDHGGGPGRETHQKRHRGQEPGPPTGRRRHSHHEMAGPIAGRSAGAVPLTRHRSSCGSCRRRQQIRLR